MGAIGPGDDEAHPLGAGAGAQLGAIRAECLNRPGSRRSMSRPHCRQPPESSPPAPGGHAPRLTPASLCLGHRTPILLQASTLSLPRPKDPASVPLAGHCLLSLLGPRNSRAENSASSLEAPGPCTCCSRKSSEVCSSAVLCPHVSERIGANSDAHPVLFMGTHIASLTRVMLYVFHSGGNTFSQ